MGASLVTQARKEKGRVGKIFLWKGSSLHPERNCKIDSHVSELSRAIRFTFVHKKMNGIRRNGTALLGLICHVTLQQESITWGDIVVTRTCGSHFFFFFYLWNLSEPLKFL